MVTVIETKEEKNTRQNKQQLRKNKVLDCDLTGEKATHCNNNPFIRNFEFEKLEDFRTVIFYWQKHDGATKKYLFGPRWG